MSLGAAGLCQDTGACTMIGVDTDQFSASPQFADVWLTSVEKRVKLFVFDTIENQVLSGGTFDQYIGDLANGATDLAPYHQFDGAIPQSLKDEIDQLRVGIIDGSIVPGA